MAREDLNPIEEARACSLLVDEFGLTREEVGKRVGRSRVAVSNLCASWTSRTKSSNCWSTAAFPKVTAGRC